MKLNIEKLRALTPNTLDAGIFASIEAQTKIQGPIFETTLIPEREIRKLAEEAAVEFPQVAATAEEAARQQNVLDVAARIRWWLFQNVDKDGRRLAKITFNRDRIIQALDELREKTKQDPTPADCDKVVAGLANDLQWEIVQPATPAPTPPPPSQIRKLDDSSDELPLDADEATMRRASIAQLQDLSRRRGEGDSHRKAAFAFQPMPLEVTRKILISCTRAQLEVFRQRHGDAAIDARLQGLG